MLSPDNEPIVRATLPLVQEQIEAITGVFYDAMLVEQPELLDLFSRSAQATGAQRRALAGDGDGSRDAAIPRYTERRRRWFYKGA